MLRQRMMLLVTTAAQLLFATAILAQVNRAAVSVNGVDGNPCSPASPCRSINYALSQTNAGGEIIVLDSGGYGAFTVTKSVSVEAAPGVHAGITAASGTAISINAGASDKLVLRGLSLSGVGTGSAGIGFT